MRRSISGISITPLGSNIPTINFFVPASASYKRTIDTDKAGRFEKIEIAGRVKTERRETLRSIHYCTVSVTFESSSFGSLETLSFGSSDYPATLTMEETEGRTSFKITYERPL